MESSVADLCDFLALLSDFNLWRGEIGHQDMSKARLPAIHIYFLVTRFVYNYTHYQDIYVTIFCKRTVLSDFIKALCSI